MPQATATKLRSATAYAKLVADLREAICSGRLAADDRIAGEIALGRDYGISVTSVRRGIDQLVRQGLLRRRQGSGTYVVGTPTGDRRTPMTTGRRDTIAVVQHVLLRRYHPYYSELAAGVRATLTQQGWRLWAPEARNAHGDFSQAPYNWDRERMWREIGHHTTLAGMLTRASLLPADNDRTCPFPLVIPDIHPHCNYVAYAWDDEIETAFRHLLTRGATRIWALGVFPQALFRAAANRAAAALGTAPPELCVRRTSDQVDSLTESVQRAYALASEDLCTAAARAFDGMLVASDFEAQGVFDACDNAASSARFRPAAIAITNRESRLRLPPSVARLVLDGRAQGVALAEMLNALIVIPELAPRQVAMRGVLEVRQR